MNTPSDEMLREAVRHMKKQNNYEKWKLLYPLSKEHDFSVDFGRLRFMLAVYYYEQDDCIYALPLDAVYCTLVRDDFLYILCKNEMMYMLRLDNDLWSMRFPVACPSLVVQLLWRCQCSTRRVGQWLIKHKKTPYV